MRPRILLLIGTLAAVLTSCASGAGTEADDYIAIPPGKADNYLSPVAQEYDVQGQVRLEAASREPVESGWFHVTGKLVCHSPRVVV